ncbi:MAG: TraR/DksA C4-type zinc finger protein [Thermomicrobiales bacterium]|nr:TraR/DksA C4-type zinc finger protein [Thermomicrobiales bacterium]
MNTETIANLHQTLIERREELTRDLEHLQSELRDLSVEQDAEGGGTGNHFADDGSSLGEQERIGTIESNFREQIAQIDQAIERMDEGTYGACQRCGQPINEERLEALPYTAFCIDCQKFLENQAELYGAHASS